jgi:UDP-N-acetylglucosamine--N-acetylmuramyl-(pentapeptide) pyrophosphoryl-undecaprenol N-acetylglucosamine transferase
LARVLYGVSPIGLGHASRAVAVGRLLAKEGVEVKFATGGAAVSLLRGSGLDAVDVVRAPTPTVKRGAMVRASLWYAKYWWQYRGTQARMRALLDELHPAAVVGDEEFAGLTAAVERGIPNTMISDELELGFARSALGKVIESRVVRWYKDLQGRVGEVLVPDLGTDSGNVRYVGPIVRAQTKPPDAVRSELGVPSSTRILLFSMSGSGLGNFLLERTLAAFREVGGDTVLVLSGRRGPSIDGRGVLDLGMQVENQNLVAAADAVVSTAGKSTIDEAAAFGTPIIAIPIRNHSEQESNALALGYGPEDADRLTELISRELARGRRERTDTRGAELTADLIRKMM